MSEVRLIVSDAARSISGTCHGGTADRVIAALSAEPESIEELDAAIERFLAWFEPGIDDEPYDAGIVVIDLAARLLACQSTYSSPQSYGSVYYHDGQAATELEIGYHLPDDWTISDDGNAASG